jgi:hypothetical protein
MTSSPGDYPRTSAPAPDGDNGVDWSSANGTTNGVKRSTPEGKVKASFNLLPEDLASLRAMAAQVRTTVTNMLQRSIRDEQFVQDQLAEGNRFAIVDRQGNAREIIWR